jgi:tRNA-dihydrouridine synthase B
VLAERIAVAQRQIELACQDKGEYLACLEARKHLAWYLRGVPHSAYYKNIISSVQSIEDARRICADIVRDLA